MTQTPDDVLHVLRTCLDAPPDAYGLILRRHEITVVPYPWSVLDTSRLPARIGHYRIHVCRKDGGRVRRQRRRTDACVG